MSGIHQRRIKLLKVGMGVKQFECQLKSWKINNNTPDGDRIYTACPDGEDVTETDPDYSVDLTFFADWRSDGISDYLVKHDGEKAPFTIEQYPDIPAEHCTWSGTLVCKAPSVGGEVKETEMTEVTLQILGKPSFIREEG
jgi:hypothetical protein